MKGNKYEKIHRFKTQSNCAFHSLSPLRRTHSRKYGISDATEIGLIDANNDGVLDDLTDSNDNGMPDVAEALAVSGAYPDFDRDGKPDYAEYLDAQGTPLL